jgi:elongation factor G
LVISAVDGVETITEKMNTFAEAKNLPRAISINKLNRERADYETTLTEIKEVLGCEPVVLQLPIGSEDNFSGVVDLVYRVAYTYSGDGGPGKEIPIPADMDDAVNIAIETMT